MVFYVIFVSFLFRYWLIWASYWVRYAPVHLDCHTCKKDRQNHIENYEEQRNYLRYRRSQFLLLRIVSQILPNDFIWLYDWLHKDVFPEESSVNEIIGPQRLIQIVYEGLRA